MAQKMLTPEILLSYGFHFNENKEEYFIALPYGNGTELILEDPSCNFQLPLNVCLVKHGGFMYLNSIAYEHQLKNLWLGITNEKLIIE